jgi:uncharacterized Zn-binding protein involved in type VI secretion
MPGAARGVGKDRVQSFDGTGYKCRVPMITRTLACSTNVLINGAGAVRIGDRVAPHPRSGCSLDVSTLSRGSLKVLINGRGAGRMGDAYGPNVIISGSTNVIIG